MWKGVRILPGPGIKLLEVDTELESSIFLLDQDHGITPRRLQRVDSSAIQHFLEVHSDFVQEGWGYSPELLLERFLIQQFNYVLGCISAPYLFFIE